MDAFFTGFHSQIFNPDRIPTILAAWLLCAVVGVIMGPLLNRCVPFIWTVFDKLIGGFGDRLDKANRPRADLMFRGFLVTVFALLITLGLGKVYELYVPYQVHFGVYPVLALALLMSSGAVWFTVLRVYFALAQDKRGQIPLETLSLSCRYDLKDVDAYTFSRSPIGLLGRQFDKGFVLPAIWYVIGGFPLALVASVLSALAWRFGKDGSASAFAGAILAVERLVGFVPNLCAAVILNMAAFITPTAKVFKSLTAWFGIKNRASYEQGGFVLSALAFALNVSLGGSYKSLSGGAVKAGWVGPDGASAKIDHGHLRRALLIVFVAHLLFVCALLAAYIWSGILAA